MGINDRIIKRARALNGLSDMSAADLQAWRNRLGLTAKAAAAQLGLSINGYAAYECGYMRVKGGYRLDQPRPIPKHVELACRQLEIMQLLNPSTPQPKASQTSLPSSPTSTSQTA